MACGACFLFFFRVSLLLRFGDTEMGYGEWTVGGGEARVCVLWCRVR